MMLCCAERDDALLRPASFLVTARAAKCSIESILLERLPQSLGFHDIGIYSRSVSNRIDPLGETVLVDMHDDIEAQGSTYSVAKLDHLSEFPGRIDV